MNGWTEGAVSASKCRTSVGASIAGSPVTAFSSRATQVLPRSLPTTAVAPTEEVSSAFRLAASCTLVASKHKNNGEERVGWVLPKRSRQYKLPGGTGPLLPYALTSAKLQGADRQVSHSPRLVSHAKVEEVVLGPTISARRGLPPRLRNYIGNPICVLLLVLLLVVGRAYFVLKKVHVRCFGGANAFS